jgi:hypothetical protein
VTPGKPSSRLSFVTLDTKKNRRVYALASALFLPYATRALNKSKSKWIDIKIDHMSVADAAYWDMTIQKDILTAALKQMISGKPVSRADAWWSWFGFRVYCPLAEIMNSRRCRALTIFVQNSSGEGVPAGMLKL